MRKQQNIINLYKDKSVNSIKYVISISNDEDLNQFWDFLNSNVDINEFIHIFIELFYNFTYSYIIKDDSKFFEVIIEENESNLYFTVWNKSVAKLINEYFKNSSLKYKFSDKRITIKLNKSVTKKAIKKFEKEHTKIDKKISSKVNIPPKTYNIFEKEDLEDIINSNDDLQDIMYRCKKMGITKEILIALRSSVSMFSLNIKYYKQISKFSKTIDSFLVLLTRNTDKLLSLNNNEILLIDKFINNIDLWLDKLFINGGEDLYFIDSTMKEDYLEIEKVILKKH